MDPKYMLRRLSFASELRGIKSKIGLLVEELFSMSIRKRPKGLRTITWMGPHGDLKLNYYDSIVCWRSEVLDQHQYDIKLIKDAPLILDIGANQGFFTTWMKYLYPNSVIHAYEPVKQSFDVLKKNVADNNFTNCFLHNFGISDKNTTASIYHRRGGAGLGDSLFSTDKTDDEEQIELINLDKQFEKTKKIDLIKMDIEGGEFPVLMNCNFWKKADKLVIEFHDNFKDKSIYKDVNFFKLIVDNDFGFDKILGEGKVYIYYFTKR